MTSNLRPDLPLLRVGTRDEWRGWLDREHERSSGVWVVTLKKAALGDGDPYVGPVDINEECLCFGWIDSKPARIDDRHTALLCTPRKPGSGWSRVNKVRIDRLLAEDRIAPAGLDRIEQAKSDGSWTKLDEIDELVMPNDLADALDARPPARQLFDAFPPSARRGILEWIAQAKTPATRAKRVSETAQLAMEGKRANQWKRS
jgi:uncharacterized protein YdeI (YjbR/CyaY-like superfamily)